MVGISQGKMGGNGLASAFANNRPVQDINAPDVVAPTRPMIPIPQVPPPVTPPVQPTAPQLPPIVRNDPTVNPSVIHSTTGTTSGMGGWNMPDGGMNPMLNAGAGPSKGERAIHAYRIALAQENMGRQPSGYAQSVLDKMPSQWRNAIGGQAGGASAGGGQAQLNQPLSQAALYAREINRRYGGGSGGMT